MVFSDKIVIKTQFIGKNVVYKAQCSSTNTLALELLAGGSVPDGTLVITDWQYQGRGQRNSVWVADPGKNICLSLVLHPEFLKVSDGFWMNIAVSLAIQDALAGYLPTGLTIKWPNDLYYHREKIGGVLIETTVRGERINASVVGIGINVNQHDFSVPGATSLAKVTGTAFALPTLVAELLEALEQRYIQLKTGATERWHETYYEKLYGFERVQTFKDEFGTFQGIIKGIDPTGRLCIEDEYGGMKKYATKEVHFERF